MNTPVKKKHPVAILAMDQAYFAQHPQFGAGLTRYPAKLWVKEAQSHLLIREREMLEQEPQYRQILPYVFIRQLNATGDYVYQVYRRTNKVGESRLAGNASAGFGGHIDLADIVFNESIIDLLATIFDAVDREVTEEIKAISPEHQPELSAAVVSFDDCFILDDTNEVGTVHVGVVMTIDLPPGIDVICAENELTSAQPMTAKELLASDLPLENWTRIYMEAQVAKAA